jgi:hypothetical protein
MTLGDITATIFVAVATFILSAIFMLMLIWLRLPQIILLPLCVIPAFTLSTWIVVKYSTHNKNDNEK